MKTSKKTIEEYVNQADWRVKENSTVQYSLGGLILSNSGVVTSDYWLNHIYPEHIANAHINADIHIHDLSMLSPYCAGWSLKQLIQEGLGGVPGKITSSPASHLSTLCNQMVNFLGCFTDDTRIILADGSSLTIREMLDSGKEEWLVKSYDPKTDSIVDVKMHNLHRTREVDELLEIEFEDGDIVKCTLDHKFYTLNRGWVEAQFLTEEDELPKLEKRKMSVYKTMRIKSIKKLKGKTEVYCGTVENDFPAFFVNEGKLVHNCLQNEWAGAQAFSSFDTYLAPFVKIDNLSYKEVKQCIQSFVYGVNTPSRWGTQAPFSNITLDWTVPADLAELDCIVGGKDQNFRYKDCQKEMDMINKAFIEVMLEGDANGRGFQYPIPTYSITKDFDWSETENNKLLFEMTAKYGTPYFSNYINSDMAPSDVRSMCVTEDTLVWCKLNGKTKHITIKELYDSSEISKKILTRFGYRDIKELQRFKYIGDLLTFTTSTGKKLTTTLDHECVVYNAEPKTRLWITDGNVKKWISATDNIPKGFSIIEGAPSGRVRDLVKKKAYEIKIGDYFTCRAKNPGEYRKGKNYDEIYGQEKSADLRELYSKQRIGKQTWNKGIAVTDEVKSKISAALKGHYVSEDCKQKSSDRWKGLNNPIHSQNYWQKNHKTSCLNSAFEFEFIKELEALGYVEGRDFIHQFCIGKYISDFYIVDKNLVIELETKFSGCSYNDSNYTFFKNNKELEAKYDYIKKLGYNLLVFNPKEKTDEYRKYINNCEEIISIDKQEFNGFVYDLEVDCDDITDSNIVDMYHTFYANEILTGNCCRLRLDLRELRKKSGGFFGSGESTGSIGVVTVNVPRIAYLAENKNDFYKRLDDIMDICAESLDIKRAVVTDYLERGLYPYTKRYLGSLNNHFSTIGLVGMNEACLNAKWIGKNLTYKKSQQFAIEVLNHMRERLSDYQEKYGDLFNLEATPAESTSYRLAKHDKDRYPEIITAGDEGKPYYTNSSHLPVDYTDDIFSALDIQDELQTLYTSGTVFHAFLGEKLPSWQSAMTLVRKIAENYKLPYYTMSPTYTVCSNCGYVNGEHFICPKCGNETEVYSRITGYYRPVQNWNVGKREEFKNRLEYNINKSFERNSDICEACDIEALDTIEDNVVLPKGSVTLYGTKVCPNCKLAKVFLDKAEIEYNHIYADENPEISTAYNIQQAPTLIVVDEKGATSFYRNLSEIRQWIDKVKNS